MARKQLTLIACRAMVRPVHFFEPMEETHSTRYGSPSAISGLVIVPWAAGDGPDGETTDGGQDRKRIGSPVTARISVLRFVGHTVGDRAPAPSYISSRGSFMFQKTLR